MIRFKSNTAWRALFYWWGGVNRHIFRPTLMYLIFLCALTFVQTQYPDVLYAELRKESIHAFGTFVVFLLVFRLNQCMARHCQGKDGTAQIFSSLENFVVQLLTHVRGAEGAGPDCTDEAKLQEYSERATVHKLNIVRLSVAWAVSWLMHCRLLGAAAEDEGQIGDEDLETIVFLYCRLQGLLYAEEMEMIDRSMHVYGNIGPEFRADINRRVMRREQHEDSTLFGHVSDTHEDKFYSSQGQTVAHLPKVVMMLLLDCAFAPLGQPWGYYERQLNYIIHTCNLIMDQKSWLDCLITMPLPLAYLQHCRVLLSVFAFCFPFSIDPSEGILNNVVMPFFLFWAIMGFEVLAEMMENPLGDDETDINSMQMIHSLEVCAQHVFDISESRRIYTRRALRRAFHDFDMKSAARIESEVEADQHDSFCGQRWFEDYFQWLPIPTLILGGLMASHGSVDTVHRHYSQMSLSGCTMRFGIGAKGLLRKAFRREHHGKDYESVGNRDGIGDVDSDVADLVRHDPNFFFHYLVFAGCARSHGEYRSHAPEVRKHLNWKDNAQRLLRGRSASSLLAAVTEEDSERSVCCMGPSHAARASNHADAISVLPRTRSRTCPELGAVSEPRVAGAASASELLGNVSDVIGGRRPSFSSPNAGLDLFGKAAEHLSNGNKKTSAGSVLGPTMPLLSQLPTGWISPPPGAAASSSVPGAVKYSALESDSLSGDHSAAEAHGSSGPARYASGSAFSDVSSEVRELEKSAEDFEAVSSPRAAGGVSVSALLGNVSGVIGGRRPSFSSPNVDSPWGRVHPGLEDFEAVSSPRAAGGVSVSALLGNVSGVIGGRRPSFSSPNVDSAPSVSGSPSTCLTGSAAMREQLLPHSPVQPRQIDDAEIMRIVRGDT